MSYKEMNKEQLEELLVEYSENVHKMFIAMILEFCPDDDLMGFARKFTHLSQGELAVEVKKRISSTVTAEKAWRQACAELSKDLERIENDSVRFLEK